MERKLVIRNPAGPVVKRLAVATLGLVAGDHAQQTPQGPRRQDEPPRPVDEGGVGPEVNHRGRYRRPNQVTIDMGRVSPEPTSAILRLGALTPGTRRSASG